MLWSGFYSKKQKTYSHALYDLRICFLWIVSHQLYHLSSFSWRYTIPRRGSHSTYLLYHSDQPYFAGYSRFAYDTHHFLLCLNGAIYCSQESRQNNISDLDVCVGYRCCRFSFITCLSSLKHLVGRHPGPGLAVELNEEAVRIHLCEAYDKKASVMRNYATMVRLRSSSGSSIFSPPRLWDSRRPIAISRASRPYSPGHSGSVPWSRFPTRPSMDAC